MALGVGEKAPDFTVKSTEGKEVRLYDLLQSGKYVILAFYPAAWTSVCGSEMSLYQECRPEFENLKADIVGISEDNYHSIKPWAESKGIQYLMLSDFNPKGEAAKKFGVLRGDGMAERALFVIDGEGNIRYSYVSPIDENPGADRLFDALEEIEGKALEGVEGRK